MMQNRALRLALSLAVSVLFLWLAFRNIDLRAAWDHLKTVAPWSVGVYFVTQVIIQLARFWRWDLLIRPFAQLSRADSFRVSNLGIMLILTLPLRLGEMARPLLLKREVNAPLSSSLGAVGVERTLDGLTVTLLFFVATFTLPAPFVVPPAVKGGALASLVLFGSASVVILGALLAHDPAIRLIRKIGEPISQGLTDKAVGMLEAFVEGLKALPNARSIAVLLFWTVVYWGATGVGYYAVFMGFGFDLPAEAAFLLVSIIIIAIMIPAGPAFLGTFQAAINVCLVQIFLIDKDAATAYGWVVYPVTVLVNLGFGVPYLFTGFSPLREVVAANQPQEVPAADRSAAESPEQGAPGGR